MYISARKHFLYITWPAEVINILNYSILHCIPFHESKVSQNYHRMRNMIYKYIKAQNICTVSLNHSNKITQEGCSYTQGYLKTYELFSRQYVLISRVELVCLSIAYCYFKSFFFHLWDIWNPTISYWTFWSQQNVRLFKAREAGNLFMKTVFVSCVNAVYNCIRLKTFFVIRNEVYWRIYIYIYLQ
jgi:hypothetical protein